MAHRSITSFRNGVVVTLLAVFFVVIGVFIARELQPAAKGPEVSAVQQTARQDDTGEVRSAVQTQDSIPAAVPAAKRTRKDDAVFESPFVGVAETLKPSVVNITVEKEAGTGDRFHNFEELFPFHPKIQPGPHKVKASGSGVIIDANGHILTNNHVVDGAKTIKVMLSDGEEKEAKLVGTDPETDLALLDIGTVPVKWAAALGNSDSIRIGDWAIAMGNPLGLDWTLTVGVISAKGRSDLLIDGGGPVFQDFIQTDASINFGNSGGPLANIHGEVIGINSAVNTAAQGIGFAIPINMAKEVVSQLLKKGYVQRGYLGMVPVELDALKKEALGLDESVNGIFVDSVSPDTPASKGGLRGSDVIVAVDGKPVKDVTDFRLRIANHRPGDKLELTVLRDGKQKDLDFTLADRSDFVTTANGGTSTREWMGLEVIPLSNPTAARMKIEVDKGVMISNVDPDGPAEGKLQPGDVIVKVNNTPVESIGDWQKVTGSLGETDKAVLVMFYRQGRGSSRFVALKR